MVQETILRPVSIATATASRQKPAPNPRDVLKALYDGDPVLLKLYLKKLPKRGWAGRKSPEEKAYIRWYKARGGE